MRGSSISLDVMEFRSNSAGRPTNTFKLTSTLGPIDIQVRPSRKWRFSRTGAQRTFRYVSTGRAERRRLQAGITRSEEHTSELQSLMRISYAVFCLKKKKHKKVQTKLTTNK